jgi:hypothetical protein
MRPCKQGMLALALLSLCAALVSASDDSAIEVDELYISVTSSAVEASGRVGRAFGDYSNHPLEYKPACFQEVASCQTGPSAW